MPQYKVVTVPEFRKAIDEDSLVLDVRTPAEHQEQHLLRPHEVMPLDRLDPKDFMLRRGLDREMHVYLLCKGGTRARTAADKFISAGFPNISVIEGGIMACKDQGEPVTGAAAFSSCAVSSSGGGGCA
jgi:rhodanese-related sulfurtransferase